MEAWGVLFSLSSAAMTLINLTPHRIVLHHTDGRRVDVPPSGQRARVVFDAVEAEAVEIGGVAFPVSDERTPGHAEGVPPPVAGTIYLVSSPVAAALTGRPDVYVPATGPDDGAIRNAEGHVVAVTRLKRYVSS